MELNNIYIYDYIKEYLNEISIVNYKKGQYITRSDENFNEIFFVLAGNVRVECVTEYGKSFLVDELSENEFVGKFSYMYEQNLCCDIKAITNVVLLKINKDIFDKLQKNPEFLKVFLYKTSNRMYYMYKKLMMKNLFSLEEIFAFYLLKNSGSDIFKFKSIHDLSNIFPISRKGLYNVINKLIKKRFIKKEKNSIIIIDKEELLKLSVHVREFNMINDSKIKFDI
ncbi:MAG: Crp/Fnr family transcriptional regulator [Firmicutes bacterium]|nr:Crp/Fnr family transcriptional regulator [Bacillota bacterium]